MPRWIIAGLCAGLAACVAVDRDGDRDVIGVSAARTAAADQTPDDATQKLLQWKVGQICTHGYDLVRQDIAGAEDNLQLVDWQFRCGTYTHVTLF